MNTYALQALLGAWSSSPSLRTSPGAAVRHILWGFPNPEPPGKSVVPGESASPDAAAQGPDWQAQASYSDGDKAGWV